MVYVKIKKVSGYKTDRFCQKEDKTIQMKQEANIYEIAKEAGVSIATVSRVINHTSTVSEKSTKRVMDAIHKLNYVPSSAARSLSTSTSVTIGVVVPDIEDPFFCHLLRGITLAADEMHLKIMLFISGESEKREQDILESMRELRLRGIIITPVSAVNARTVESLEAFEALGIPVVLLDREMEHCNLDCVVTDDEDGVYHATSALIELGHRDIAIITGPYTTRPGQARLHGYKRALAQYGLPLREDYIREGDFKVHCAYERTLELLRLPQRPTAIFASNNMTTYGCLRALHEENLIPGKDIALVGYDDIPELGWLNYPLSVVGRDVPAMGEQAMRRLLQRFETETQERIRICLGTELILRGSERAKPSSI